MNKVHNRTTHGMFYTRQYRIWAGMKRRCYNKNDASYPRYGGIGIKICNKWKSFVGFWEDMKNGYSDNLSIDRIDNSRGYNPKNCRWADSVTQSRNRKKVVLYEYYDELLPLRVIASKIGVSHSTLILRRKKGLSGKDLIAPKKLPRKNKHISWDKNKKKWIVSFKRNGKNVYVGRYKTIKEARIARDSAPKNAPACEKVLKLLD